MRKKVSNGAKIRNRYNQVPHLTQDTNGKVTNSQKTPQMRAKRSALSNTFADNSRVGSTIILMEKLSFSLKLFSDDFYGQSFIKTV